MNQCQFVLAVSFALGVLSLASVDSRAQTNIPAQQTEKSSDPAIRWQFDTHG